MKKFILKFLLYTAATIITVVVIVTLPAIFATMDIMEYRKFKNQYIAIICAILLYCTILGIPILMLYFGGLNENPSIHLSDLPLPYL